MKKRDTLPSFLYSTFMSIWRPSSTIQVKALGLVWRDNALLASEIPTDEGRVKGVRPLGGTVEFGEIWQDTLTREFQEELGTDVKLTGQSTVLENIYSHHGVIGHEVIFLSNVVFVNKTLYSQDEIIFSEDDGTVCKARWFNPAELAKNGPEKYPNGLLEKLLTKTEEMKE